MLFPYQIIVGKPIPWEREGSGQGAGPLVLLLIRSLRDWLNTEPEPRQVNGESGLDVGFQDVTVPVSECAELFGGLMAAIQQTWPVSLYGIADTGELMCLELLEQENALFLSQKSISGQPGDFLHDICLRVQLPDEDTAAGMAAGLQAMKPGCPAAALSWEYAELIRAYGLGRADPVNAFCYVCYEEDATERELLHSLTFEQKRALWLAFLQDGSQALEFEWLSDELSGDRRPAGWLEWTLALHQVLRELGYELQISDHHFQLLDGGGQRVYYSVDHSGAPEKVLMKILFPLND